MISLVVALLKHKLEKHIGEIEDIKDSLLTAGTKRDFSMIKSSSISEPSRKKMLGLKDDQMEVSSNVVTKTVNVQLNEINETSIMLQNLKDDRTNKNL